jgi:hypothetical protein
MAVLCCSPLLPSLATKPPSHNPPRPTHLHSFCEAQAVQDLGSSALGRGSPNLSHALINLRQASRHVTIVLPARRRSRCLLLLGMRRCALLGITVAVGAVEVQVAKLPAGRHGKKAGN